MMSKAAVIAAVAFAAPTSAVAPCRWFRAEDDSPSQCMSEAEHVEFSSITCQLVQLVSLKGEDWTAEDCAAIPFNQNGDRCVAHGKQCLTPEAAAMSKEIEELKSAAASCRKEKDKDACNLTEDCHWVEGDFYEHFNCMPKQAATESAFCRLNEAEDDCNGATPPLFSDLVEEDMYIFDAPVDNSEDQLLRGQGESKDEEKIQEDEEKNQEDGKKDQEKIQEGEDDQDELDHGVDDQDEDQEDRSMILSNALKSMVKKAQEKNQEVEDDQDELDQLVDDIDFDFIGSGSGSSSGSGFGSIDFDALADIDLTDLNDALADWDDVFADSDDSDSTDTDKESTDKDIQVGVDDAIKNDADIDLTDLDLTDKDIKKGLDDAIKNVKEKDDASAASHIAVSFLAVSITAVLLSL